MEYEERAIPMNNGWIYREDYNCFVCSICGSAALNDYAGRSTPSPFCPYCGNPMNLSAEELNKK